MTVYVESLGSQGEAHVVDANDGARFVVVAEDWKEISALPNERQRAALDQRVAANVKLALDALAEAQAERSTE